MFETRCANYIFSDYDWYPCQLQCPTGLSSTMGLLWYSCNFRSDAHRYISSLNVFLGHEICNDISTCGFTNAIQLVRTQKLFRWMYIYIYISVIYHQRFKVSLRQLKKKLFIFTSWNHFLYTIRVFHMLWVFIQSCPHIYYIRNY